MGLGLGCILSMGFRESKEGGEGLYRDTKGTSRSIYPEH